MAGRRAMVLVNQRGMGEGVKWRGMETPVRDTVLAMACDPFWGLFTSGIPLPILRSRNAPAAVRILSAIPT